MTAELGFHETYVHYNLFTNLEVGMRPHCTQMRGERRQQSNPGMVSTPTLVRHQLKTHFIGSAHQLIAG